MDNIDNLLLEWQLNEDENKIKNISKKITKKEAYLLCKRLYKKTSNDFYLKSIKKINWKYIPYTIYLKKKYGFNNDKTNNTINKIKEILSSDNSKKVCIFQLSFYDKKGKNFFSGGAERYALDLADIISKRNYKTYLIQLGSEEQDNPWILNKGNLTILGINLNLNSYNYLTTKISDFFELIIYSGMTDWFPCKQNFNKSIIISHGITWDNPCSDACISFIKNNLFTSKTIVSVDTNTISWFRSTFAKYIKTNNIQFNYIANYVDLTNFYSNRNKNNNIKILFPRRCSDERGFWIMHEAMMYILEKYDFVELDIVGFVHEDKIQKAIDLMKSKFKNRVDNRVLDSSIMKEAYSNADISLIPTLYSEGTSLSCIEAMASGNAVIATNIGGLTNLIIDGYNGILINPETNSLIAAIEFLLNNPKELEKISKNATEVSKVFSKEIWERKWNNVFSSFID
ncbi:glycosyltransferase family 4 protein [Campylobacter sp. 2018MI01]|uniref:glycosyltransferase family 4 protein n=1 Tax=Campylobacter sp. 2018MI01 TaxID=2836735 RepID=UPI001BDA265D|nr:glycosyltransferase family 4 protein [Campylobacter sp. 2018MI01]